MGSLLFSPYTMRGLEVPNRIVVSPMCQYAAAEGSATDWHIMHLGNFAVSGPGLVITEATAVEPEGRISPDCLGLYSDANEEALARVIAFFRAYSPAKFGIQLAHAGRKGSVPPSFKIRKALGPEEGGWIPPSPSYYEDGVHTPPVVMDEARIRSCIAAWRESTIRAARMGVDLIELHFAHGYLVNEFLSPLINTRTDQWGGSLENRMRFALEIFKACRAAWPEDRPMGVRISATDWVEGEGWDMDDSVVLSRELKALGCDYICPSSGGVVLRQKIDAGPNYQVPFAERIRAEAGIATIAVGQITEGRQAEDILQQGKADMVALARRMLYDPRWAWHAAQELGDFVSYAPRYLTANPKLGPALKFAESPEKSKDLEAIWAEEARHKRVLGAKT